jgi:hypothetical protein
MQKNRLGNFPTRFIIEPQKIGRLTYFFVANKSKIGQSIG